MKTKKDHDLSLSAGWMFEFKPQERMLAKLIKTEQTVWGRGVIESEESGKSQISGA